MASSVLRCSSAPVLMGDRGCWTGLSRGDRSSWMQEGGRGSWPDRALIPVILLSSAFCDESDAGPSALSTFNSPQCPVPHISIRQMEKLRLCWQSDLSKGKTTEQDFRLGLTPKFRLAPLLRGFSVWLTKLWGAVGGAGTAQEIKFREMDGMEQRTGYGRYGPLLERSRVHL